MNLSEEASKIVASNTAANEQTPWFGYQSVMERMLMVKTGCDPAQAYYAIAEASMPHLTLKQLANRIIDLEEAVKDLLTLARDLAGDSAEKYETYQKAREVLTRRVGKI